MASVSRPGDSVVSGPYAKAGAQPTTGWAKVGDLVTECVMPASPRHRPPRRAALDEGNRAAGDQPPEHGHETPGSLTVGCAARARPGVCDARARHRPMKQTAEGSRCGLSVQHNARRGRSRGGGMLPRPVRP